MSSWDTAAPGEVEEVVASPTPLAQRYFMLWTGFCAPSGSVALNKGHKHRDYCCQALLVAEGRCPGCLKTSGVFRTVEQWCVGMVTATHLGIYWSSANIQPGHHPAAGRVPQLHLLALANWAVSWVTRGWQISPAWLETAVWQLSQQTM